MDWTDLQAVLEAMIEMTDDELYHKFRECRSDYLSGGYSNDMVDTYMAFQEEMAARWMEEHGYA